MYDIALQMPEFFSYEVIGFRTKTACNKALFYISFNLRESVILVLMLAKLSKKKY